MSELISVVIPVYNHALELSQSLGSLLNQKYRPLEVIIVDDGSTDDFEAAAAGFKNQLPASGMSLKIIRQKNAGAPAARNRGLAESAGEYVIFWDADTIGRPEMFSRLVRALKEHPEGSYAYCDFKFGFKKMPARFFEAAALKQNNYIDITSLIRREAAAKFDESLKRFQDWDYWLTMLEQNKTGTYVPEMLYKKLVGRRRGIRISGWLPKFFYKLPWKTSGVRAYERSREIILRKHGLL